MTGGGSRMLPDWEQGRRKPDATSRACLAVIAKAKNGRAVWKRFASEVMSWIRAFSQTRVPQA